MTTFKPFRMWTPARRLAELVAKYRGLPSAAWLASNGCSPPESSCFAGEGRRRPSDAFGRTCGRAA